MIAACAAHDALFNPLRDLPWYEVHWPGDPAWTNPGDGNPIASLRDGTGSANHATQATSGRRPLFIASGINGKPVARSDGLNDALTGLEITPNPAQPFTVVAVGKYAVAPSSLTRILGTGGGSGGANGIGSSAGGSRSFRLTSALTSGATDANAHLLVGVANGASSKLQVDGTTIASGNIGAGVFARIILLASSDVAGVALGNFVAGDLSWGGGRPWRHDSVATVAGLQSLRRRRMGTGHRLVDRSAA